MRFPATLTTDEAPGLLERFVRIIGPEPWQKRWDTLREQVRANPLMREFTITRHGLELSIGELLETLDPGAGSPFDIGTPHGYAVFSFIAPVVLIYDQVAAIGKNRIAGILQDGLNTDKGLRPFQTEVETAVHLMHAGFDVTPWDIERGGGFDFLAVRDDVELEVECKSVSGDLGRQIHSRRMLDLSDRIRRALDGALGNLNGGQLVRVALPTRLPGDSGFLDDVAAAVKARLAGVLSRSPSPCEVEVRPFELAGTPFASPDPAAVTFEATRRFVEQQLGESNVYAFTLFRPGKRAVIVVVDSRRQDRVVGELLRDLKGAAKGQFSRERPAILVVQFLDLGPDAMLELAAHDSTDPKKAPALQLATSRFLQSAKRSHIHTVVYRSHGTLTATDRAGIQEQGPTYSFTNVAHAYAQDRRYRPFSLGEVLTVPGKPQSLSPTGPAGEDGEGQ